MRTPLRLAILTYSTKPRGGVVHSLSLAEALLELGVDVHLVALGAADGEFFRHTKVPFTLIPVEDSGTTLDDKVFASVDAMAEGSPASSTSCTRRIASPRVLRPE